MHYMTSREGWGSFWRGKKAGGKKKQKKCHFSGPVGKKASSRSGSVGQNSATIRWGGRRVFLKYLVYKRECCWIVLINFWRYRQFCNVQNCIIHPNCLIISTKISNLHLYLWRWWFFIMKQKTKFYHENIPLEWCWTCPRVYRIDRKVQSTLILQTLAKIGQGTYCQKPMPTLIHYQSCPSMKQRENRVKVFIRFVWQLWNAQKVLQKCMPINMYWLVMSELVKFRRKFFQVFVLFYLSIIIHHSSISP